MRTQQLFHLQKALVMHSGGEGAGDGGGIADQVLSKAKPRIFALLSTRTVATRQRLPWALPQEAM